MVESSLNYVGTQLAKVCHGAIGRKDFLVSKQCVFEIRDFGCLTKKIEVEEDIKRKYRECR